MNCPNCGEQMDKGYIIGRKDSGLPWYPENEKATLAFSESSMAKRNGLILGKDGHQFPMSTLSLENARLETFICRKCRKGVFSY